MNPYQILKEAQEKKYAVGSFNFSNAEILRAIVFAFRQVPLEMKFLTGQAQGKLPVIVSTSEGEANFFGMKQAVALVNAWRKEFPDLKIFLNLDHGKSLEKIKEAVEAGYDMVHFDGSTLSYEQNIEQTKEIADFCRKPRKRTSSLRGEQKILVEGELGYLRGTSALHEEVLEIKPEDLTSPEQAADFVKETRVDSLAIVIGNAHGIFTKSPEQLDFERLKVIRRAVGDKVFLVLHGGSGISAENIRQAIDLGIVKINVNTELRLAYQAALKKFLTENPNETTPYKILGPTVEAVQKVVENKIKLFYQ